MILLLILILYSYIVFGYCVFLIACRICSEYEEDLIFFIFAWPIMVVLFLLYFPFWLINTIIKKKEKKRMNNVKVNLIMTIPGMVMMSEKDCAQNRSRYEKTSVDISANPQKKFYVNVYTRGCKPASKTLNISLQAYRHFVSREVPENFSAPVGFQPIGKSKRPLKEQAWSIMNKWQRLEWHLNDLCASMGGTLTSYKVYDDV